MTDIKIVSFNIWDLPLWYVKNRRQRLVAIGEYLRSLNADIICLQESFDIAHRTLLHQILGRDVYQQSLGQQRKVAGGLLTLDTSGGLVIFSKYPFQSQSFVKFPTSFSSFVEIFSQKGFLDVVVKSPHGLVRVLNTHLHTEQKYLSRKVRLAQLRQMVEQASLQDGWENIPTIFTGDFNEPELLDQPDFFSLLQKGKFSHHNSELLPTYRTNNPLVNIWINRVASSRKIDYIFTKLIEQYNLVILQYEPIYLMPTLSDHDPLVLLLTNHTNGN